MTREEIAALAESAGVPCAWRQFPDGTQQEAPFLCYYTEEVSSFYADGVVYAQVASLIFELYTREKDFGTEALLEAALTGAGLGWRKDEDYVSSEELYMTTYTMEVLLDVQYTEQSQI